AEPGLLERVLVDDGNRGVLSGVDHHQHLARQGHRLEDPVKHREDVVPLVVGRDHHRDSRQVTGHMRTPDPSTFQMSATGLSVTRFRYCRCGVAITSRSDRAMTSSCGSSRGSTLTYGSAVSTVFALNS